MLVIEDLVLFRVEVAFYVVHTLTGIFLRIKTEPKMKPKEIGILKGKTCR